MSSLVYAFTLSEGAVRMLGQGSTRDARERLSLLTVLWARNGLLVTDPSQKHIEKLGRVCDSATFPQPTRKLVKDFLMARGPRVGADNWPLCETPPEQDVEAPPEGTWFVGEQESEAWGLNDECPAVVTASGVEICRIDGFSKSRWHLVQNARILQKKVPIEDAIKLFSPVCGAAKSLVIIDPYCGKEEVVKPAKSGLLKCLKGMSESQTSFGFKLREISIYTAKNVARSMADKTMIGASEILKAWRDVSPALRSLGLRRINLHLVSPERFSKDAHDRFAKFDNEESGYGKIGSCAFQVGPGFAIFEGKRLSKGATFSMVPDRDLVPMVNQLESDPSHEFHRIELDPDT